MDMNLLYINPSAERVTGFGKNQALGRKCWEIFGDIESSCRNDCPVESALHNQTSLIHLEGNLIDKTGKTMNISVSVTPLVKNNCQVGAMVLLENFTNQHVLSKSHVNTITCLKEEIQQRLQVEKELRRNKNMLDKILNTVPQAIFWKDPDGRFLGCNNIFAQAMGFEKPEQIIGLTDHKLPINQVDAAAYRTNDREVIQSGQPKMHIIEPLRRTDGSFQWLDTSKVPLLDENEIPIGVLGVFADITDRKEMEDALEKRILALTMPLDDPAELDFEDLFHLEEVQRMQDTFSMATGVACLIVHPDGTPITRPSNFSRLCSQVIRKSELEIGRASCRERVS
jgi:PAS domain S-box-containing protein